MDPTDQVWQKGANLEGENELVHGCGPFIEAFWNGLTFMYICNFLLFPDVTVGVHKLSVITN